MNYKIDFLKQTNKKNKYGELKDDWNIVVGDVWARKDELLGNEFFNALTTNNKVETKFNSRWIEGITSDMRIKCNNILYEIIGPPVNVKGRNTELLCYCKLVK